MGSRRVALVALLPLVAMLAAAPASAAGARAATYAQGIDVSHYQGSIDWTQTAAAATFAFAKATEGATLVDVTYPVNRMGAESVGVKLGAYHFARPSGSGDAAITADAIAEADFFLSIAQPQPGDLPPVLDLETTGGLKPPDLLTWTSAWLGEVTARTGVHAIVYTSPNFWKNALDDSGLLALDGTPLWVAHWTTASAPLVPAENWGGAGWTFWQWTSHGRVPGIGPQVDRDRFKTASVAAAAIQPYPTGVPVVSAPPTIVGSAQTGKRVTAVPGAFGGGKPITFTYQWQRCDAGGQGCAPIPGATAITYLPAAADVGHALTVAVTAESAAGAAAAVAPPTLAVAAAGSAAARPAATTPPTLAGTPEAGQTLTLSVGAWTGSPTSFAYQWQRCAAAGAQCAAIVGATKSSYQLGAGDIGSVIAAVVTATGRGGSASATASTSTPVAPAVVPAPASGSTTASSTLAGAVTTADGTATLSWQPGAIPDGSLVTVARSGKAVMVGVSPAVAELPWPVELAFSTPSSDVVGYSTDGKVYLPATPLTSPALPLGVSAGTFAGTDGNPHVLLRVPASVRFFTPGRWGDPRLVAARPPQPRLVGPLHVRRAGSAVIVTGRVIVPSQALLFTSVLGRTRAHRSQLLKPGGVPVRIAARVPRGRFASLRIAARDPWGRTAALVTRFRAS
jgi:GH25 family lysozyme M1 (1,4-beta-N-acetylmuramidase)